MDLRRDQRTEIRDQRLPHPFAALPRKGGRPQSPILRVPPVPRIWGPGRPVSLAALACILIIAGCRQDMQNQPKMIPQRGTEFFADHRGSRPQVEDTVARGQLHEDSYFYTGVVQGANGYREERDEMPFPVNMEVLKRGQERFNIYCTPCHSRVGNGLGEIVDRGYKPAANLMDQVRLSQPISHYFFVMTHGYGAMPDYSAQLNSGGSLGGRGLHSRAATQPGQGHCGRCSGGRAGSQPEERGRRRRTSGVRAAVGAAGDRGAGLQADSERRNAGNGAGESG